MYRRKNIVIIVMCVCVLFMAIGYAAFSVVLNINGTVSTTTVWDVKFTNITEGVAVGSATNNTSSPSFTETTAYMDVNLALPGDSMTYELTLSNEGTVNAVVEDVAITATGSSAIIHSVSGINIGDSLPVGKCIVITIKMEYDDVTSQPSETEKSLTINVDCAQAS